MFVLYCYYLIDITIHTDPVFLNSTFHENFEIKVCLSRIRMCL